MPNEMEELEFYLKKAKQVVYEVKKTVVGKDEAICKLLMAILAKGHILIEDIPGVGKTTMALAFSKALGLRYNRMQFTPDVLPSDVTGFSLYNKAVGKMEYQPGAVLCNLFLADELNRATSRTQAALLEAMEEGHVTVDGVTHDLPAPFVVLATQNPIGSAGTQNLPNSQLDRFLIRTSMGYPDAKSQIDILKERHHDAGCDGVVIIGGTGVAVSGSQTANRHDTSHTGHETGQGVNEGQHVLGGDTGQTGCLGVAAHAVDLAAQSGLAQEDIKDDEHNDDQNEAEGDAGELHLGGALIIGGKQRAAADPHEAVNAGVGECDGLGAGNDQCQAPQHVLHAHGGHEGMGQIQTGQQCAVDEAGQGADGQAAEHQQEGVRDAGLDHNADGAGAQHAVGTNGQVDTGGNQGAQHTGSDQAVDGCLLQDIHEVTDLHELVRHGDAENQNQDGKGHQCTELLQKLFHFRVFHISLILLPRPLS